MEFGLRRNWWMVVLRGVLAIIFGLMALSWPGLTLLILVMLFGAYALIDGVFDIAAATTGHQEANRWWALIAEGIVGIGAGIIAFLWPGITALALVYLIAFWAVFTGILEIVAAARLREQIQGEWALALAGVVSLVFGLFILFRPGEGALAIVWLIALYAIFFGVLLVVLGFQLRSWERELPATPV